MGRHFLPRGNFPGIEPLSPVLQESSSPLSHQGSLPFPFSSVQSLSRVQLFAYPSTAAPQASLPNSWRLLKLMSIELVTPSNHLTLCRPLLLLQSWPASGAFQMSQLFTSRDQSIAVSASASVLPMNTQD